MASVNDMVVSSAPMAQTTGGAVNLSLVKVTTLTQTLLGVAVTALVVVATVVTVILIAVRTNIEPPQANPDYALNFKTIAFPIYPLHNDNNPRGGNLTLQSIDTPQHGTAEIIDQNWVQYQSVMYWAGTEVLNYTCRNDYLTATSTITVTILNHPPEPIPQSYIVKKNSRNTQLDLFAYKNSAGQSIIDIDNDLMQIVNVSTSNFAEVTYDPKYVYYTPKWGFNSADLLTYCVTDFNDTACNIINIRVDNTAPVARPDHYNIPKFKISDLSVMDNDYDENQDPIYITEVGSSSKGGTSVNPGGLTVRYMPPLTTNKDEDSFDYTITDGDLFSYTFVVVDIVNAPPTAKDVSVTIHKNTNATQIYLPYADTDVLDVLVVKITTPPANGAYQLTLVSYAEYAVINTDPYPKQTNNYSIVYTPKYGLDGVYVDTIKYLVNDGSDNAEATVTINVINDPPVGVTDTITVHKNIPSAATDIIANDYDPNGDSVKLVANSNKIPTTEGGYYVVVSDTSIVYYPKQGFRGQDTATYTLTDIQGDAKNNLQATGNLVFNVINDPPTPAADTFTVNKGLSLCLTVLANDTDPNGDDVSINDAGAPSSKASAVITTSNGVQCINYTALNQVYTESWLYTAQDNDTVSNTAQAMVTVNVINNPPVAVDDSGRTSWNQSITINVVANDYDINPGDNDLLTVVPLTSTTTANGGSLQVVAGKAIQYTPPLGWIGVDTFTYKVSDQIDVSLNAATVTITVVDNAPVANPAAISMHWGTSASINLLGIAGNVDPDADPIVVKGLNGPVKGSSAGILTLNGAVATYAAQGYFVGTDSFNYTISDWLLTAQSTVSVTVLNTPPVAAPVSINVHWNSPPTTGYVRSLCSDADNDPLSIARLAPADPNFKGTLTVTNDNNNVVYTPTNWKGVETRGYTITDGPAETDNVITITVTNNNVPTASPLSFTKHWSSQVLGTDIPILQAGQKDADGDVLSFTTTAASNGAVTSDGQKINYKQNAGYLGSDAFSYTVSDGLDTANAPINFVIFDNAPTAKDYALTQHWRQVAAGWTVDTITACNASDVDVAFGDVAKLANLQATNTLGTNAVSGNTLVYTPFNGVVTTQNYVATFTDGLLNVTANIALTVQNVVPTAAPVAKTVHWSTQTTGTAWDLIANGEITDADSDSITITEVDQPANGNVALETVSGVTKVRFTQTANYLGNQGSFQVKFTDGWQANSAIWQVTVVDAAPVAVDQTYTVAWTTYTTGTLFNVLVNATDSDPQDTVTLKTTLAQAPTNGTAVYENGQIRYTPTQNFVGVDSFKFTVTDGLLTDTKTVTINVVDKAPVAVDDAATMHWALRTVTLNVMANDNDPDNDPITFKTMTQQPSIGSMTPNVAAGTVTFTIPNGQTFEVGTYTGRYTNTDGPLVSNVANIVVNVVNPNSPTAPNVTQSWHWRTPNAGVAITIPGYTATTDADGDAITLSLVGTPQYVTKTDVANQPSYFTYTHALWKGDDSFQYQLSDGMASPKGFVNVNSYNNKPTALDITDVYIPWTDFAAGSVIDVTNLGNVNDADAADLPFLKVTGVGPAGFAGSVTSVEPDNLTVRYKPATGFTGTDSFTYTVSDGLETTTATVTVYATYSAPNPGAQFYKIHWSTYNAGSIFKVLDGWGDAAKPNTITGIQKQPTTGNSVTVPEGFGVVNNTIKYKQRMAYLGTDTIILAVSDGLTATTITVTIVVYDNPPVAVAKTATTHWKNSVDTDVVAGATDIDSPLDTPGFGTFGTATNGLTSNTGNIVTYAPQNGFVGVDSYTFTVSDGLLTSQRAVTVTVTNTPPVPTPKTYDLHWRDFIAGQTYNLLAGDTDPNTDSISLVSVTQPDDNAAGTVTPTLAAGTATIKGVSSPVYYGKTYHFSYTETDGASNGKVSQQVTVNVKDQPPVATNDAATIHWRETGVSKDVLSNDNDPDTQDQGKLSLGTATPSVAGATATVSGSNIVYTPKSKWTGVDQVSYTLFDGAMYATTPGVYTVTVMNTAPVAKAYTVTKKWSEIYQTGVSFTVGADATDNDNLDKPFLALSGAPSVAASAGVVSVVGSGLTTQLKFVPAQGYTGTVSFPYTITDGLATATATITITVTDAPPTATPSTTPIHWRAQLTSGTSIPVQGTLIDPDNDPVTLLSVVSPTASGTASVSGGNVVYKQNTNFLGADTFRVSFSDSWLPAVQATYSVNVYDNAPVAYPLSAILHSSKWQTGVTVPVISNPNTALRPTDTDTADQGFITVSGVSGSYSGSAVVISSNSINYKPVQNQLGSNIITYTVSDGLLTGSSTLNVTVYDNAPTNTDKTASVHWRTCAGAGVTVTVSTGAIDQDPEDTTLTYALSVNPQYGVATQTAPGVFTYVCNSGTGRVTDTFLFTTSDGTLSTTNKVTVTVTNTAPVAVNDAYVQHWKSNNFVANVLANDTDANTDPFSIASGLAATSSNGATLSTVTGGIRYNLATVTPAKLNVADTFTYKITDTVDQSNAATVSVTLYDTAPTATPAAATIQWNQVATFNLGANCDDADSADTAVFSSISNPVSGTVAVTTQATGAVKYTPGSAPSTTTYSQAYNMNYFCTDGLLTGQNVVTVTVKNTAPSVTDKSTTIQRNYNNPSKTLSGLRDAATDADGDAVTVSNVQLPAAQQSGSTLTWSTTSDQFTITVPPAFLGQKTVNWAVYDGQLYSPQATYTITYTNNAPVCAPISRSTNKNTPVSISGITCTDANNDPLTYSVATAQAQFGSMTATSAPVVTYTPAQRRSGTVQVSYTATDVVSASDSDTITIIVTNRAPNALPATYDFQGSHTDNTVYTISTYIADSGSNDPDTGDSVSIQSILPGGTCSVATTGSVALVNGNIQFTRKYSTVASTCTVNVRIIDNDQDNPLTDDAVITINVSAPQGPTATDDYYTVNQNAGAFQIPIGNLVYTNPTTQVKYNGMMLNDIAPTGVGIVFDSLVTCTTGYCRQTPTLSADGQFVNYPVDIKSCVQDKFQYKIRTNEPSPMYATATVFITFTNCYCSSALDIFFVVDSSQSITQPNFNTQVQFLYNLSLKLDIGVNKVNVGVAQFADDGKIYQSLSSDASAVRSTISGLPYLNGATHTLAGLVTAVADITGQFPNNGTTRTAKGRANVPKVLVVITDGCSNLPCSCGLVSTYNEPWKSMHCQKFYASTQAKPTQCSSSTYPNQDCSNCNLNTFINQYSTGAVVQTGCMPCADPIQYTNQINSWKVDSTTGATSSPYPSYPIWKVIAMGIGSLINNSYGRQQISGMNYDHNQVIMASWANLNSVVSTIIDAACNTN